MIKKDQIYLEHILEAITKIENFTQGISRFDFDHNVMIQDATGTTGNYPRLPLNL